MKKHLPILTLAIGLSTTFAFAQEPKPSGDAPRPPRDGERGPRPMPPLVAALDTNKDGVIDADEIVKASDSLKTLDKNKDGKLTLEELRPERPPGQPDGERRPGPRDGDGKGRGKKPDGAK
jgi:hypothetical protein